MVVVTLSATTLAGDEKCMRFTVQKTKTLGRLMKLFGEKCGMTLTKAVDLTGKWVPLSTMLVEDGAYRLRRGISAKVITLEREEQRRRHVAEEVVPRLWRATTIRAVDGRNRDQLYESLDHFGITLAPEYARSCTVGQLGCACSHLAVWETIRETTLILEDDVVLPDDFDKLFDDVMDDLDMDFDLVYLFHHPECRPPDLVRKSPRLVEGFPTWGTVAYVVSPRGASRLLKSLSHRTHDKPIDRHIMDLLDLDVVCADPPLVSTAGIRNPLQPPHLTKLGSTVWGAPRLIDLE